MGKVSQLKNQIPQNILMNIQKIDQPQQKNLSQIVNEKTMEYFENNETNHKQIALSLLQQTRTNSNRRQTKIFPAPSKKSYKFEKKTLSNNLNN